MIELLIVIGVLGILAVGVLAAIDPFEQLKKARDTNTRASVISLHTAFTRYYATHNALPWNMSPVLTGCSTTAQVAVAAGVALSNAGMTACVNLGPEADGELKTGFVTNLGSAVAGSIYIQSATSGSVNVCFSPVSKSMFAEEATKFSSGGVDESGTGGACTLVLKQAMTPGSGASSACYYCAK